MEFIQLIQLLANRLTVNRMACLPVLPAVYRLLGIGGQRDCPNTHYGRQFFCFDTLYGIIRYVVLLPPAAVVVGSSLSLHIQDFILPYLACTAPPRGGFFYRRWQTSAEISFKPD